METRVDPPRRTSRHHETDVQVRSLDRVRGDAGHPGVRQPQGYSDVPENHWAYEALVRLKREGLLVGYPDGEFKGRRLTTRYELASAIYAVYTTFAGSPIRSTARSSPQGTDQGGDTQALRDQLAALQADINQLKGYGDEIATLRRLVDSFQKELESLGVDVKNLKDGLSDLQSRVDRLEKKRPSIEISGDANLFVSVGFGNNGGVGANSDGKVFGFNKAGQDAAGLEDLSVIHDLGVNFRGTNELGPQFKARSSSATATTATRASASATSPTSRSS